MERLAATPYLEPLKVVVGWIYDVESGRIDDVVHWERAAPGAPAPAGE